MQRIIIADESEEFRLMLTELLGDRYEVCCCADGVRALELLREMKTDLLVLDLMLTGMDGMGLLKTIRSEGLTEAVVVTGRLFSDYVMEALSYYGVDYAMQKPCCVGALVERIDELCGRFSSEEVCAFNPGHAVEGILMSLNMPLHRIGFQYTRDLILMKFVQPDIQITKSAYPELAKRYNSNYKSVEKAIRAAIDAAWQNRNDAVWRRYFPMAPNGSIPKPTNTEFATRIAVEIAARTQRSAKGG